MTDHRWEHGYIDRDGASIYWEHCSSGVSDAPTVVLTHGAGGSHAVWFQQVVPLLDAGFDVVTWDSRGFGLSEADPETITAPVAASDLAAVLDSRGLVGVHLVGQSMGGWYVTEFALNHPGRTRSLALCDTIGSLFTDELRTVMQEFRSSGGLGARVSDTVGDHVAVTRADATLGFLYQQLGTFHSPPLEQVQRVLGATSHDPAEVGALGIPVLVLAGDSDPIFPPEALRGLAEAIEGASWVEIADSGHSPYFEQPAAFNRALLGFLAGAVGRQ